MSLIAPFDQKSFRKHSEFSHLGRFLRKQQMQIIDTSGYLSVHHSLLLE